MRGAFVGGQTQVPDNLNSCVGFLHDNQWSSQAGAVDLRANFSAPAYLATGATAVRGGARLLPVYDRRTQYLWAGRCPLSQDDGQAYRQWRE